MRVIVLVGVNLHYKYEMPSFNCFTHIEDTTGAIKVLKWVTRPDHVHLGNVCHPKANI